jgi:flagellar basal-body rod protein FlgF
LILHHLWYWHGFCNSSRVAAWESPRRNIADAKGGIGRNAGEYPMENALLVGLSRQMALTHELDIVANNIANMDTTGYKADNAQFSEYLMPGARDGQFSGKDRLISFVQDRAGWIDFSAGSIQRTGNPLDVAIDGDGYLAVQTPRGVRYTRNGALQTNATGQLVTDEGYPVLGDNGPITFQPGDHDVIISQSGIITVRNGSDPTEAPRGQLQLAAFTPQSQLQKDGDSMFFPPAGVNPVAASPNVRVVQGAIEKSNVNAVVEMSRMIQITQSYNDIASVLQQQSDQRKNALTQLSQAPTSGSG